MRGGDARMSRLTRRLAFAAALVLLAAMPYMLDAYRLDLLAGGLAYGLMAASLAFLVGHGGLPSLGHAAFLGVGAYAAGLTAKHVTPNVALQLLVAIAAGVLFALLTGWFAVRTRGFFFLMFTLAIGEIAVQAATRSTRVTGGDNGLADIPPTGLDVVTFYWWALAVVAVGFGVLVLLRDGPLGRSIAGARENEARMAALGYHVTGVRLAAVVIAGAVCAAGGALVEQKDTFVAPTHLEIGVSVLLLIMVLLGGRQTLIGPLIAGVGLIVLRSVTSTALGELWLLVEGALFVICVYLLPNGLLGRRRAQAA
ncbi:branched-chain amino acid ABC transporter permease [Nonomuraea soli]|uniref:Branched-chain amino acid transport system permease protein n=1 Tax=Nonomuraea soli TaxID=1032476 RepID=A0A7W0CJA2_9ACTN|nr:branched-chain amino acid ABC transporter permease [Nonomuraea soli]MBA2892249.1 branched-chain amino acid transport system permease protein [Nonomuraea soli]